MSTPLIVMIIICAALLVISAILFINNRKIHKDIDKLSEATENEKLTEYSTADNHFSRLHNAVADLENRLRLEKSNTERESKKNTEFISAFPHTGSSTGGSSETEEDPIPILKAILSEATSTGLQSLIPKIFRTLTVSPHLQRNSCRTGSTESVRW